MVEYADDGENVAHLVAWLESRFDRLVGALDVGANLYLEGNASHITRDGREMLSVHGMLLEVVPEVWRLETRVSDACNLGFEVEASQEEAR